MKRCLVDVNVWVALLYEGHQHHDRALRWFRGLGPGGAVCCRHVQIGLLRSLTNVSIMGPDVCSMKRAWELYWKVEADERFAFESEPEGLQEAFQGLSALPFPAPKVWADAYLAAFSNTAGLALATLDAGIGARGGVQGLTIIE